MSLVLLFPSRQSGVITGTGAVTLPLVTVAGTGELEHTGSGALTLPIIEVSGTGSLDGNITGTGALSLPIVTISGSGVLTHTGTGSLDLPSLEVAGSGLMITEVTGSGAITLPLIEVSGTNITEPAAGGGIGQKRRRHRQFANINGRLVEVASYADAERLFKRFSKKKPKKRRIKLKFKKGTYVVVMDDPDALMRPKEIHALLDHVARQEDDDLLSLLLSMY